MALWLLFTTGPAVRWARPMTYHPLAELCLDPLFVVLWIVVAALPVGDVCSACDVLASYGGITCWSNLPDSSSDFGSSGFSAKRSLAHLHARGGSSFHPSSSSTKVTKATATVNSRIGTAAAMM